MDIICIVCPNGCRLSVEDKDGNVTVSGNKCPRGIDFAQNEMQSPMRSLTTCVATDFAAMPLLPVRTDGEIPKNKIFETMALLNRLKIKSKVKCGDIIAENILQTGCNVIATATIE